MKVIPREARRVTYSTEIRELKKKHFTSEQRSVVVGNILGDGCLCENWSKTNYRLQVGHSIDQKQYIMWKYSVLQNWILTKPRFYARNNSLTIQTISHPELTSLHEMFYKEKKKIIPEQIESFLKDPLIMAVWFMDDGNAVRNRSELSGYNINSQSFSRDENILLSSILYKLYSIESIVERNHNKFRLAIWKRNSRKIFRTLIEPYILNSMKYKLG